MMDVSHRSDIAVPIRDLILLVVLPYCLRRHAAELLGLRGHPQLTQVGQKPHSMGIRDLPLLLNMLLWVTWANGVPIPYWLRST